MKDFSKEAKKVAADYWYTNDLSPYLSNKDKEEYNREPVYWCAKCKSLMIINFESELDTEIECYCGKCGSTEIIKGSIQEWESLINKQNN